MKLSLLVPVRPNSKFIAHFLMDYVQTTKYFSDIELLLMPSPLDTWNKNLFAYFSRFPDNIKFFDEPAQLGQAGHYIYLNELNKYATGDWVLHICDDMFIIADYWDEIFFNAVEGLDHNKIYQVIPRFEPSGAHVHGFSRGWLDVTGRIAGYPNTDSWNNTVMECIPSELREKRLINIETPMFQDTSNDPDYFVLHSHGMPSGEIKRMAAGSWESDEVQASIKAEGKLLLDAIEAGR